VQLAAPVTAMMIVGFPADAIIWICVLRAEVLAWITMEIQPAKYVGSRPMANHVAVKT
jgi:hypothetical protein